MDASTEDARKKRDSDQVVKDEASFSGEQEKSKKFRSLKATTTTPAIRKKNHASSKEQQQQQQQKESSTSVVPQRDDSSALKDPSNKVLDLESALHRTVRIGKGCKESLSPHTWVKFRVGHAGDAAVLATCYRNSLPVSHNAERRTTSQNIEEEEEEEEKTSPSSDTSLEVRLADGLGDEDTPPSVFALLAELYSDETGAEQPRLGAVALLTLAWQEVSRVLRVEWLYIDRKEEEIASVLEQRLWLRLSALGLMISCPIVVAEETTSKASNVYCSDSKNGI